MYFWSALFSPDTRFSLARGRPGSENVDQTILRNVTEWAATYGWNIERHDMVDALTTLVAEGLAQGYLLSRFSPFATELRDMPALDVPEEDFKTYFYITQTGREFLLSNAIHLDDPGSPTQT